MNTAVFPAVTMRPHRMNAPGSLVGGTSPLWTPTQDRDFAPMHSSNAAAVSPACHVHKLRRCSTPTAGGWPTRGTPVTGFSVPRR